MRTGGCLCGAIRYSLEGEPFHVGRCHCADCRKESGSTYTIYGQWPRDAFTVEGEDATYDGRSFCPRCGSSPFTLGDEGARGGAGPYTRGGGGGGGGGGAPRAPGRGGGGPGGNLETGWGGGAPRGGGPPPPPGKPPH